MSKVPFTQAGFEDLADTLYALSDPALNLEADALLADYIQWADDHVVLATAQISYLQSMPTYMIDHLAAMASIGIRSRVPLNLILPSSYSAAARSGKWFLDRSALAITVDPSFVVVAAGHITYEVVYPV